MDICFTGTSKGPIGYDYDRRSVQYFKAGLYKRLEVLVDCFDNITFYCGGALQFDQIAQLVCNDLKLKYKDIRIVMAIPFKSHGSNWRSDDCLRVYKHLLETADTVVYTEDIPEYNDLRVYRGECSYYKYILRDNYMVDNTSFTISCHDGVSKGTKATMDYTRKLGHTLIALDYLTLVNEGKVILGKSSYEMLVRQDGESI